jgi:hypothetical protein
MLIQVVVRGALQHPAVAPFPPSLSAQAMDVQQVKTSYAQHVLTPVSELTGKSWCIHTCITMPSHTYVRCEARRSPLARQNQEHVC